MELCESIVDDARHPAINTLNCNPKITDYSSVDAILLSQTCVQLALFYVPNQYERTSQTVFLIHSQSYKRFVRGPSLCNRLICTVHFLPFNGKLWCAFDRIHNILQWNRSSNARSFPSNFLIILPFVCRFFYERVFFSPWLEHFFVVVCFFFSNVDITRFYSLWFGSIVARVTVRDSVRRKLYVPCMWQRKLNKTVKRAHWNKKMFIRKLETSRDYNWHATNDKKKNTHSEIKATTMTQKTCFRLHVV